MLRIGLRRLVGILSLSEFTSSGGEMSSPSTLGGDMHFFGQAAMAPQGVPCGHILILRGRQERYMLMLAEWFCSRIIHQHGGCGTFVV